jgi:hypothetical protein
MRAVPWLGQIPAIFTATDPALLAQTPAIAHHGGWSAAISVGRPVM